MTATVCRDGDDAASCIEPRRVLSLSVGVLMRTCVTPPSLFVLLLLVAFATAAQTATVDDIRARVESGRELPMATRLRHVSDPLVGAPYASSPLGEESGPDQDPRLRYDAFDCTTFVETAIALALVDDVDDVRAVLDRIRYRGETPSFQTRRHFPESEWIPDLIAAGVLEDITRQIAGDETVVEKKTIDRASWAVRKNQMLSELAETRIPYGTHVLEGWPLKRAQAGHARIPPGTVISVMRQDVRVMPVRVSHQGLVIEKNGVLYMRHAADKVHHKVVDEKLDDYLARLSRSTKWPVTSIHLARVTRPSRPLIDPLSSDARSPLLRSPSAP
jgi:hypothetical protein